MVIIAKQTDEEQYILDMITSDEDKINVMTYVKVNCQLIKLSPQTLGMLFELYAGVQYDEDYST